MAVIVDRQKQVALGVEGQAGNVPSVGKGQRVGLVVDEVEDGDAVAYGRQQTGAIGAEAQVSLAIDGAKKIGELCECVCVSVRVADRYGVAGRGKGNREEKRKRKGKGKKEGKGKR